MTAKKVCIDTAEEVSQRLEVVQKQVTVACNPQWTATSSVCIQIGRLTIILAKLLVYYLCRLLLDYIHSFFQYAGSHLLFSLLSGVLRRPPFSLSSLSLFIVFLLSSTPSILTFCLFNLTTCFYNICKYSLLYSALDICYAICAI